jgi:hypothetical protein
MESGEREMESGERWKVDIVVFMCILEQRLCLGCVAIVF